MEHRIPLIGAVITCALLATGLAWTDESEGGTEPVSTVTTTTATTSVSPTSTTAAAAPTTTTTAVYPATVETIADQSRRAFFISGAGTVVIGRLAGSLWVFEATTNPGWTSEITTTVGPTVSGEFSRDSTLVTYAFTLDGDVVRVQIVELDGSATTTTPQSVTQPPTTSPATTLATTTTVASTTTTFAPTTTTVAPTTTFTPTTTTTRPDNEDSVKQEAIDTEGGTIIVSYSSEFLNLESVDTEPGFDYNVDNDGPNQVVVDFESDAVNYEVTVVWTEEGLVVSIVYAEEDD